MEIRTIVLNRNLRSSFQARKLQIIHHVSYPPAQSNHSLCRFVWILLPIPKLKSVLFSFIYTVTFHVSRSISKVSFSSLNKVFSSWPFGLYFRRYFKSAFFHQERTNPAQMQVYHKLWDNIFFRMSLKIRCCGLEVWWLWSKCWELAKSH